MKKLKNMIDNDAYLAKIYDTIVTLLYVLLILIASGIAFMRFAVDDTTIGFYWTFVALYWAINYASRAARKEIEEHADDDIGDVQDDDRE